MGVLYISMKCAGGESALRTEPFAMLQEVLAMNHSLTVTYYHHSGFSVATEDTLLIFDYWLGEKDMLPEEKRITLEMLNRYKRVYVFISHEHRDHCDPVVFTWRGQAPVRYIISDDMPGDVTGERIRSGETMALTDRISVTAYDSTDLGVSFLVTLDGVRIFHAGDLNFWHWRDEVSIKEIEEAEADFTKAMKPLEGLRMDVAFFPVDPRMGQMYDAGANTFIMAAKPRLMLPMHFWGRKSIAAEFARRSSNRDTQVIALTRYGEELYIHIDEDGVLSAKPALQPETMAAPMPRARALQLETPFVQEQPVEASAYEEDDPFSDTDLPIQFEEGQL